MERHTTYEAERRSSALIPSGTGLWWPNQHAGYLRGWHPSWI